MRTGGSRCSTHEKKKKKLRPEYPEYKTQKFSMKKETLEILYSYYQNNFFKQMTRQQRQK